VAAVFCVFLAAAVLFCVVRLKKTGDWARLQPGLFKLLFILGFFFVQPSKRFWPTKKHESRCTL